MREPRDYEAPLCAQVDGELWFPEPGGDSTGVRKAVSICRSCIHQTECAEWGIRNEKHGIWGGITAVERKQIRARRRIRVRQEDIA